MKVEGYQAYKNSEIEWLVEVPAHWEIKKFNYIAQIVEGQIDPKEEPYKDYVLIAPNHIESGTGRLLYKETAFEQGAESGKYLFRENDVIYSKIRPALKKVWKASFPGICSADMYPIRLLKQKLDPDYFTFLCLSESFSNFMIATSMRVAMPKVNRDDFHECFFVIPLVSEQKAIAHYLDTKTAQIDRKIDLLTQKATLYGNLKQSLINETVTRGLDKSVPMKDSGIEWIGEVPKHWEVRHFKQFSTMKGRIGWQGLKHSEFIDEGPFLITGMNFKDGKIRWDEVYHITNERYEQAPEIQLKENDILMTKDGTIGKLLYVDKIPAPHKASLNSHLLVFRPIRKSYYPRYLYYQLGASVFQDYVEVAKTGTTFFGISQAAVGRYIGIIPPLPEQKAIANYLDTKTAQIDQIIQTINTQIEKLKELRKTMINDVVTGKIKVV